MIDVATPLATVDELMVILRGKFTDDQQEGLQLCIDAATWEIASFVDPLGGVLGDGWNKYQTALANRACLAMAVEYWKLNDALFGIVGSADIGALRAPKDMFARFGAMLNPLKEQWGFA